MKACFKWIMTSPHQKIFSYLSQKGGEARFVGSAVRDSLLGRPIQDFDVATTHTPLETQNILEKEGIKVFPTGIAFGTVTALLEGTLYEITTLRQDLRTDGRHAEVSFTTHWEKDSQRRDFTINALYLDSKGRLYDFHKGLQDLKERNVRFIGIPQERLQEDFLRILRFFRFSAFYAKGSLDKAGLQACQDLRQGLKTLSRERVTHEFLRLLEAPHPWQALEAMGTHDLLEILLEAPLKKGWSEDLKSMSLLEEQLPPLFLNRKEHALCRLKGLVCATEEKKVFFLPSKISLTRQQQRIWRGFVDKKKKDFLSLSHAITRHEITPLEAAQQLRDQEKILAERKENPFPLKGEDVMALGISPSKVLGELLAETKGWWEEDSLPASKEDCLKYVKKLISKKKLAIPPEGEGT
jgi:poly(A) polymerase